MSVYLHDYTTAILEVRPLIGSYVTIAQMIFKRDIEIIDCTSGHANMMDRFGVETVEEIEKAVWSDINDAFSKPAERSDSSLDYIPTQIVAELFKSNGLDGVGYKSSYGEIGYNIALFDIDVAEVGDCYLSRVNDISLKLSKIETDGRRRSL